MIKNRAFIFIIILLLFQYSLFAVKHNNAAELILKDGDRVVFIGNSITHGGLYHLYIQSYYQTRFPDRKIEFYNCGIGGDVTTNVLNRIDYDILPHKPTVAVIKLGMNDAGSTFYEQKHTAEELQIEQNRIVAKYTNEMREIIRRLKDNCNPRLFLIKPTPYDPNFKQANRKPLIGKNETIRKLTLAVEELAKESNATVVDFYNPLNDLNIKQQLVDSTFTVIGKDRVHPGSMGHLMMAYLFLKTQQVPEIISKVEIDINHKIKSKCVNATLTDLKMDKNGVSFELVENAIPFPINQDAIVALKYMPVNKLNSELFVLKGIDKGLYRLKIDSSDVGTFTSDELNAGINMAIYPNTPQNRQAQGVLVVLKKAFDKRVRTRDFLAAKILIYKAKIDVTDSTKLKSFAELKRKENTYYGRIMDDFIKNSTKIDSIETELTANLTEAIELSKPVKHLFVLIKNK
ncbi:MAG: SGNH/GDSL hydrolase family protein [Paludibacter sp.]